MNIDSDKLLLFLEKRKEYYLNTGLYEIIDIWEMLNDRKLDGIPKSFFQGFREGIVEGLLMVKDAIEEAEETEWSLLR